MVKASPLKEMCLWSLAADELTLPLPSQAPFHWNLGFHIQFQAHVLCSDLFETDVGVHVRQVH